tara:strand:+ start:484 stop:876 length:393 start_codon:yes stop_codon:yes gene_type:complete
MAEFCIFLMGIIAGAFVYSALVRMMGNGAGIILFKQVELECLAILALSVEDAAFIKTAKHQAMTHLGYDENTIKITINEDEFTLERWKLAALSRLHSYYPTNLVGSPPYSDWQSAMKYLNDNSVLLGEGK